MLRLLSWSSSLSADKMGGQEVNFIPPCGHHAPIDLQKPPAKRRRPNGEVNWNTVQQSVTQPPRFNVPPTPGPSPGIEFTSSQLLPPPDISAAISPPAPSAMEITPSVDKMEAPRTDQTSKPTPINTDVLSSEINQEILFKHNELRLIDQEIAKCQIALEQLRRCTEIPYPTAQLSESVKGRGSAIRSSRSSIQPQSPAPWGVTDGPYTRHYARWLIPDPLFDGGEVSTRSAGPNTPAGKMPAKGRSTRGSIDPGSVSKLSRGALQTLPGGYPPPKEKGGPMIQKRKSDGILVKLACLDCRRDNFSSAQGFINHCRIAHGRNFASHDAAADACGEPIEVDEDGAPVGAEPPSASMAGLVHPLIYSAHTLKPPPPLPARTSSSVVSQPIKPDPSFVPSPLTPNLSTLIQKRGGGLDLKNLLKEMQSPVPEDEIIESESESEDSPMPEAPFYGRHPQVASSRHAPAPLSVPGFRPTGVKLEDEEELVKPALTADPFRFGGDGEVDSSPTNESNQAPSLVDDDGDDDYDAPTPSYSDSEATDEHADVDIKVEDGDEESGPMTRNRCDEYSTPKQPTSPATRRTSALRRSISGREEKHVSFVSPSPARDVGREDRKRKRTSSVSSR